ADRTDKKGTGLRLSGKSLLGLREINKKGLIFQKINPFLLLMHFAASQYRSDIRLWRSAEIRLDDLMALWKFCWNFFRWNSGHYDHILTMLPIRRCGYAVVRSKLQRVDYP